MTVPGQFFENLEEIETIQREYGEDKSASLV